MTMFLRRFVCAVLAFSALLAGCGSDTSEDSATTTYCDLIDIDPVAPVVGDREVKDFGQPVPKNKYRTVTCTLYAPDERPADRLLFYLTSFELRSDDDAREQRAQTSAAMAKYAVEDPDHYVALEADGDDLGFAAWIDEDTASAGLVTDERDIFVTAAADAEQAKIFTPLMLEIAQEFDANLDRYDSENPAD